MITKAESLTETEFLDQEHERAKLGLARTLSDMKRSLKATTDPQGWIREYPLTSVAAGLAAGLVVALASHRTAGGPDEPIVVEGRFRGLGRRPRRRRRSFLAVLSVGARWAARSFLRGFIPI